MGKSRYTCSECGQEHDDWPAIAWSSPSHYASLSEEDKENMAQLSSDFCTIFHESQTDRFIRCCLDQKVVDHDQPLEYGVWVSLSERNYADYYDHFDDTDYEATYFGWLCSDIPEYGNTLSIPLNVIVRPNGSRPVVVPHEDHDHDFVRDFYNGISLEEAIKRIHVTISAIANRGGK